MAHSTDRPSETSLAVAVRAATFADAEAIRSIYNHYVLNSTATFDTSEQSVEQREEWLKQHFDQNLPVVVAVQNDTVIGWGSLSYYHSRCAYRTTVEPSIYVHESHRGKGVGRTILGQLLSMAEKSGYHCVVGLICSENEVSIRLCNSFGFRTAGELQEVGKKFNRWLNVTFVQKVLTQ